MEIQRLLKNSGDVGSVLFIEKIHEGFARRRDPRALVVKIFQLEIAEPEIDDGSGVFF